MESSQNEPIEFAIQIGGDQHLSVTPQSSAKNFIKGSKGQFEKITKVIELAGQTMINKIENSSSKPSECSIEFGINVGGESGIPFVTKGTIAANFKVSISWKFKD